MKVLLLGMPTILLILYGVRLKMQESGVKTKSFFEIPINTHVLSKAHGAERKAFGWKDCEDTHKYPYLIWN